MICGQNVKVIFIKKYKYLNTDYFFYFRLEIKFIAKTSYIYGVMSASGIFTERITLYLTIIVFVMVGNNLSANVAFSLAQLFNSMQLILSIFFPKALSSYSEAVVSINRYVKIKIFILFNPQHYYAF